jgi:hypothetical protein
MTATPRTAYPRTRRSDGIGAVRDGGRHISITQLRAPAAATTGDVPVDNPRRDVAHAGAADTLARITG